MPTPVLAEFLILAGKDSPDYLEAIRDNSIFRIEPFDQRSAIQLADLELTQRLLGNKRGSATDSEGQKVKFDRQIVATAMACGASRIYSDDPHIAKHGADCNYPVIDLKSLPLPGAVQTQMFQADERTTPQGHDYPKDVPSTDPKSD